MDALLDAAAEAVAGAEALIVCAGAGMGRDSGLPDYRGKGGLWRNYAEVARTGLRPEELCHTDRFDDDPELIWGYFAHCVQLYGETEPHEGYRILRRWAEAMPQGHGVFTSNVDGHFARSGFERIVEWHGAHGQWQCTRPKGCTRQIWPAPPLELEVDPETMRARGPLPSCPRCGALARPNILLFWDASWIPTRTAEQMAVFDAWIEALDGARPAVVELGAGTAIPSVRQMAEKLAWQQQGRLIRINPAEPDVPPDEIGLAMGALEALQAIDARVSTLAR